MRNARNWLSFIALVMAVWVVLCQNCWGNPFDSVCEVSHPKGSGNVVGSGVCVRNSGGEVWTLTNAHVIRDHRGTINTQWVWQGTPSKKLAATEVWRLDTPTIDLALLRQSAAPFGERLPVAARILPEGIVLPKDSIVYTIGCPGGANPTLLECRLAGYQTHRAGMKLLPRVENGRSGGPVFSEDGRYLVGLVDSWDLHEPGKYGSALYASQIRVTLSKMIPEANKPRLFDGSFCQGGICGNRQQQQQTTPPGTGQAYPDLPPLAGIGEETPTPAPLVDDEARKQVAALEAELTALKADLADKETRLQALFGTDYALLREIAADAKAAKATAEDAKEAAGALTGAVLAVPGTVDEAVEKATADLKEKAGLIDRLKARLDASDLKTAAAASKVLEVAGTVKALGGKLSPWSLAARFGWMPVGLVIGLLALWGRVEWKRRTGQEFKTKTGEVLAVGTEAAHNVAEAGKDYIVDKAQRAKERIVGRLFGAIDKAEEDEEDERILGRLRSVLGGAKG